MTRGFPTSIFPQGVNQLAIRTHNEKLLLTILRDLGSCTRSELSRQASLSPQASLMIVQRLEDENLVTRSAAVRGKIGQPSVPFKLNPDGPMAFGLSIGRCDAQFAVVNLLGEIRATRTIEFAYPDPDEISNFVARAARETLNELTVDRDRVRSFGVGMPFEAWQWPEQLGLDEAKVQVWKSLSIQNLLGEAVQMAPKVFNDSSAACFGELVSGSGQGHATVLYVNLGTFVGGGIALASSLFTGENGPAANIAAMPVRDRSGQRRQLWEIASLWTLERGLEAAREFDDASKTAAVQQTWLSEASHGIAQAILSAAAFFQPGLAVIDGAFSVVLREQLVSAVRSELTSSCPNGLVAPQVRPGNLGPQATVIGAARLSMSDIFLPNWICGPNSRR